MKTQLQYPNGLLITIEYDEQFAPKVFNENSVTIDQLKRENTSLKMRVGDLLQDVQLLKKTEISLNKTADDFKNPVPEKKVKPAPEKKEKPAPKWSKKPCAKCGQLFQPTGPRSSVCSDCKQHEEIFAAGNDFSENPE